MLKRVTLLLNSWNDKEIVYIHWKSNDHLEDGLNGISDLDILVDARNKQECESTLKKCCFIKCIPQFGSRYPDVDDWIGFDTDSGKLIHIHLHYEMVTGHRGIKEYTLPWKRLAFDTRIFKDSYMIYVMEPNLEIITLYTRIVLKKTFNQLRAIKRGSLSILEQDQAEISNLKRLIEWEKIDLLLPYCYHNAATIKSIILKDSMSVSDFRSLYKTIMKEMKTFSRMHYFKSVFMSISYRIFYRLRLSINKKLEFLITRKTFESGGKLIAFIGQDGSGKSTIAKEITEWLSWKMDVKKFYLGTGEDYLSWRKTVRLILSSCEKIKQSQIKRLLSGILGVSDLRSRARRTFFTLKTAQIYRAHGGIAVFDRYPQNQYSGIYDGPKIRSTYLPNVASHLARAYVLLNAKIEERYLAKSAKIVPDIVFKLVLSSEESLRRKPYEDVEQITKKQEITQLLNFTDSMVYTINAEQPFKEELLMIKRKIWRNLKT